MTAADPAHGTPASRPDPATLTTRRGFVVAVVGAESTGKTTLARGLAAALADSAGEAGGTVAQVGEYLREFCDARRRTPRRDEQQAIAACQTGRIAVAAASHGIVVADTTAVMIAVYSDFVFGDRSLYADAGMAHHGIDLLLLTSLDVPWQADGLQRDGPQVRAPIDALLRAALARQPGPPVVTISGDAAACLRSALRETRAALQRRRQRT